MAQKHFASAAPWLVLFLFGVSGCRAPSSHATGDGSVDERTVRALIEKLASPVPPPPHAEQGWDGYVHPKVAAARKQLGEMSPKIYPLLAEYREDSRYSFSGVYAIWVDRSVGSMVEAIMEKGVCGESIASGYKSRENPRGSNMYPCFGTMVYEMGGLEKYADHAKEMTQQELRREYVAWHVRKERGYGFSTPEDELAYLTPYVKKLEELDDALRK